VRWSVGIEAEGDRVLSREEVVELADAVAVNGGIATGIGTSRYGAQLIVEAGSREEAIATATTEFTRAVAQAGLPAGAVVRTEAVSEDEYAVIYVGHSDDLSAERFPFQHPRAHCWVRRAGSKWTVYICTYEVPGGGRPHREQIVRELTAIYQPRCNDQQFDQAWKDEWIGGTTSSSPGLAKDPARPGAETAPKQLPLP